MVAIPQTHHGLCVADIDAARLALASVGFTTVQPNAPEPLVYADAPDDLVVQLTCPDLGSPYRTHYVEHPGTGHQIDLIEIAPHALVGRPADEPVSGDLTVVMPLRVDIATATAALEPFFGDRLEVTGDGEPWATLHIAAVEWPAVRTFFTDVLDVPLDVIGEGRFALVGVGGRMEIAVSSATVAVDPALGKRYPGANHLRLLHRDLAAIDTAVAARDDVRWILPPSHGFAFVAGPGGLTIEMFDEEVSSP